MQNLSATLFKSAIAVDILAPSAFPLTAKTKITTGRSAPVLKNEHDGQTHLLILLAS